MSNNWPVQEFRSRCGQLGVMRRVFQRQEAEKKKGTKEINNVAHTGKHLQFSSAGQEGIKERMLEMKPETEARHRRIGGGGWRRGVGSECHAKSLNFILEFRWEIHYRFQIRQYWDPLVLLDGPSGLCTTRSHSPLLTYISCVSQPPLEKNVHGSLGKKKAHCKWPDAMPQREC